MTIKERMIKFLEYIGKGQTTFESEVGLSRGHISNIGEGISTTSLIKIIKKYPDLNTTWLLTGQGAMLLTHRDEDHFRSALNEHYPEYEQKSPEDLKNELIATQKELIASLKKQKNKPDTMPGDVVKNEQLLAELQEVKHYLKEAFPRIEENVKTLLSQVHPAEQPASGKTTVGDLRKARQEGTQKKSSGK